VQATLLLRAAYDLLQLRHPTWTEQRLVQKAQEQVFELLFEDAYEVGLSSGTYSTAFEYSLVDTMYNHSITVFIHNTLSRKDAATSRVLVLDVAGC
jgi:GMP synthase PP-ATPase subunit